MPVHPPSRPRPGRAALLITRILERGYVTREQLAREFHVSPEKLDAYQSGAEALRLNHQARLALFVIATIPELAAEGNRLRQQVAAAISYQSRQLRTDDERPAAAQRQSPRARLI